MSGVPDRLNQYITTYVPTVNGFYLHEALPIGDYEVTNIHLVHDNNFLDSVLQ